MDAQGTPAVEVRHQLSQWLASFAFTVFLPTVIVLLALGATGSSFSLVSLFDRGEPYLMSAAMVGTHASLFMQELAPDKPASRQLIGWFMLLWVLILTSLFGMLSAARYFQVEPVEAMNSWVGFLFLGTSCVLSLGITLQESDGAQDVDRNATSTSPDVLDSRHPMVAQRSDKAAVLMERNLRYQGLREEAARRAKVVPKGG